MSDEKRKTPRIDFHLQVMIKGHQGLMKIKDFSLTGLFVEVQDSSGFEVGDELELIMKLPQEKDPIRVKAQVTRVTKKSIGVEFVELPPQHAMALEYCFHIFKHTVPISDG